MNLNFCEIEKMTNEELLQVYCLAPQALENKFTGSTWVNVLESKPELAIHCEWHKLNGNDWCRLLCTHPEFAKHCNWDKLSGSDWSKLLSEQPEFVQHCNWDKLNGQDWRSLLNNRPDFVQHCDWDKLDGDDWFWLLCTHPEFAEYCDWDKLSGSDWSKLLSEQPKFVQHCDWDKLRSIDLFWILSCRPQFAKYCNLNKLDSNDWSKLLYNQDGDILKYCNLHHLNGNFWAIALNYFPAMEKHCNWSKLNGYDWANLLSRHSNFSMHCDWSKLSGHNWVVLLQTKPEYSELCDWSKLTYTPSQTIETNSIHFSFSSPFNNSQIYNAIQTDGDWAVLLKSHPEFAVHCNWSKLPFYTRLKLFYSTPELAKYFSWQDLCSLYRNYLMSPKISSDITLLSKRHWKQIKSMKIKVNFPDSPKKKGRTHCFPEKKEVSVTSFLFASWLRNSDNFGLRFKFTFEPVFLLQRRLSKKDTKKYDFPTESPGEFWIQHDIARDLYKKHFQALLTHHKWKMLEKLLQLDAQKFIQVLPFKTLFLPLLFAAPESLIMNVIKAYENNVKKKIAEFHDKRGNNMLHYLFVRLLDECPAWVFNPPEEYRGMEEILIANGADPAEKNLMQLSYLDCMEYFRSALQEQKC